MSYRTGSKDNGLGHAVAKAVCSVHHWYIEYDILSGNHPFIA